MHEPIPEEVERIGKEVVDAALKVHRALGPGLLESVYEACLCHELAKRGIKAQRQLELPVVFDGEVIETGLRLDVLAGECVIVENKSVEKMIPLYEAQIITYLKLTGKRLGYLINFNVPLLKEGIKRFVN
jgi:GxxExxY protein